jgi:hypothetical protein
VKVATGVLGQELWSFELLTPGLALARGPVDGSLFDVPILADEELTHPSGFYARRTTELGVAADECTALYSRHTQFLIVLALLACGGFYQSVIAKRLPIWAAVLVVPVGAWVIQKRHHLSNSAALFSITKRELPRLARKWDLLDEGDKFIDPDHFYSRDLDPLGPFWSWVSLSTAMFRSCGQRREFVGRAFARAASLDWRLFPRK